MPAFAEWIKRTAKQVWDPGHEERVEEVAQLLLKEIQKSRNAFSLSEFSSRADCSKQDLELAKREVYRTYLDRGWRDGKVTEEERKVLDWAANRLEIPAKEAESLQVKVAQDRFATALARAMDDGHIDEEEAVRLAEITRSVNSSLGEFVRQYFQSEGESFLRGVFAACTQDGMLATDAWLRLTETTKKLGLSRDELSTAIHPQALRFVEHALADAKSDEELSEAEERQILDLIKLLGLPPSSRRYYDRTITSLRTIRQALKGKLPIVDGMRGVAIKAGELVHLHLPASWLQLKQLRSGDVWDRHVGMLTITDNRLMFSSETKSFDVRFGKIIAHTGHTGQIRLQRAEKPESVIQLAEDEPVAYAVLEGAIALSNQTRVVKVEEKRSRFIPREVRQRVWQKYGGQCAECGDTQYLEFDHVIPVAKGGSNSDVNVQLLCRKCNLKKSDLI